MACANSGAVVAVEVFIEENQISPVRVLLEFLGFTENRPHSVLARKNTDQTVREFGADLLQVHKLTGASGTFDFEIGPDIAIPAIESVDQHEVHGEPDRTAPVGVASKHSGRGFGWVIVHGEGLVGKGETVWFILVAARQRANAIVAEKFVGVEHT